ncbi:hypothetical protein [Pontibacter silvestris]|uniref:hypothetical protein n=1 Tax=Pontibacter silvestris TaxID=2305183 RepID=UPI001E44FDA5|nr:hypothetical protein [Pontibacter silvestris]
MQPSFLAAFHSSFPELILLPYCDTSNSQDSGQRSRCERKPEPVRRRTLGRVGGCPTGEHKAVVLEISRGVFGLLSRNEA